jgi:hypothetical protein
VSIRPVQGADEGRAARSELREHRPVDELDDLLRVYGNGGERTHAAGVRARVTVADALEVLGRRKRSRMRAVAEREDGYLFALEQFLDHDVAAECGDRAQTCIERGLVAADEDAFPCGETVRLDNARRPRDGQCLGGRNAGCPHDVLGELFRAFDARCCGARAEDRHACVSKLVCDAGDERRFGTDDDQVDFEGACEHEQSLPVLCTDRMTAGAEAGDAGVPGGGVQLVKRRRLGQFPGERVLASA